MEEEKSGDEKNTDNGTPEENTGWVESLIVAITQSSVGQTLFKIADSFLWIIEKTAQWSLPVQEIAGQENGKICGKLELVRPLPWFFFLPGLVILRIIRFGLNVGARILGYPQVQPSGMVRFVQRSRRRLRSVTMMRGVKPKRRMFKEKTMIEAKKALIRSIRLTLSTLSCLDTSKSSDSPPPMKICIGRTDLEPGQLTTESVMKRKYSELISDTTDESEDETLCEKLAEFQSADDISFNPVDCSTSSTENVQSEKNKEVSGIEVQETTTLHENNKNEIEDENKDQPADTLKNVPVDCSTSSTENVQSEKNKKVSEIGVKKVQKTTILHENNKNGTEGKNKDQPANTLKNVDPSSKNVQKMENNVEQDVDSSGESVYWSGMEFDGL